MDLNHIKLPPTLVTGLYQSVLVNNSEEKFEEAKEPKAEPAKLPETDDAFPSLGENKKNILVTVNHEGVKHIPDDDLSFLVAMLTACKLTLGDVAIINLKNFVEMDQKSIVARFQARVVFLFGTSPDQFGLPLNFPEFQIQSFAGSTYLFTPPLGEIRADETVKRRLWESLKRLFVI